MRRPAEPTAWLVVGIEQAERCFSSFPRRKSERAEPTDTYECQRISNLMSIPGPATTTKDTSKLVSFVVASNYFFFLVKQ